VARLSAPGPDQVQLWISAPEEGSADAAEARAALLTEEELDRARRFHFEADRRAWVCAHALLRWALSGITGQSPHALSFQPGAWGKPRLVQEPSAPALQFSLSHTRTLVAAAVATVELGVDVERVAPERADAGVAERFFSTAEVAYVREGAPQALAERFFSLWTLKEAYLKARGFGLSVPLSAFSFRPKENGGLSLSLEDSLGDRPEAWAVSLRRCQPDHHVALCVRAGDRPLHLSAHRWVDPRTPPRPVILPPIFQTVGAWRGGGPGQGGD
jgi:4'-phosphopantetheinyl transferase